MHYQVTEYTKCIQVQIWHVTDLYKVEREGERGKVSEQNSGSTNHTSKEMNKNLCQEAKQRSKQIISANTEKHWKTQRLSLEALRQSSRA